MQSSQKFNEKYFKKLPLGLILLLLLLAGAILLFVFIMREVLLQEEVSFDNSIFSYLSTNVINSQLTTFMKAVTHMASSTFLQIGYGV